MKQENAFPFGKSCERDKSWWKAPNSIKIHFPAPSPNPPISQGNVKGLSPSDDNLFTKTAFAFILSS